MVTFTSNGEPITQVSPQYDIPIVCNNGVLKVKNFRGDIPSIIDEVDSYKESLALDPNKTYTISFYVSEDFSCSNMYIFSLRKNGAGKKNIDLTNLNNYKGKTYSQTFDDIDLVRLNDSRQLKLLTGSLSNFIITDGSITTDGTTETVEITGKNLFDKDNNLLIGYYINNRTGQINESSDGSSSCFLNYLPSSSNITYTMSSENISRNTAMRMWAYDKDKNPISAVFNSTTLNTSISGTTPEGTAYIRCSFGTIPQYRNNIQLEQGSTATEYEPYFNGGEATAEMLLKVGNYQDIQSVLDGKVTRNIGIKVLDGSESWVESYNSIIIRNATAAWGAIAGLGGFCTHLTVLKSGETTFAGSCRFAGDLNIYEYKTAFDVNDVEQFKQYLADQYNAGYPVVIIYPLAEPTTETVTAQALTIQAGTNIITAEGSIDNLPLEVSYKAGVRVTITEVQNAQLDNNVEVTING